MAKKLKEIAQVFRGLNKYMERRMLEEIAEDAEAHYKKNFFSEGFDGKRWTPSKRKGRAKGAAGSRRTLTGATGQLGRSLTGKAIKDAVVVYSDVEYARYHNEGRGVPKREFMGPSKQLEVKIRYKIEQTLRKFL